MKLTELVGRFGLGLSGDSRRCRALLADACGEGYRGECAVLVGAVEEGIPGELLTNSSGMPKEMLLERLSRQLQSNRGFAADLARWAVECWAVALGVISGTDNLSNFKMDGLAPLIDLAGADGTISTAELNHLLSEAKVRGVSEADARAYLTKYAAARGWTIVPRPSPGRKRTPQPPSPPPPQPQARPQPSPGPAPAPTPAAPPRTSPNAFRWAVGSIIGLVALGGVLIATVQHSSVPPSTALPSAGLEIKLIPKREGASIVINGEIINTAGTARTVPRLRVALRDGNRNELEWRFVDAPVKFLATGKTAHFETTFYNPNPNASGVVVTFAPN